MSKLTVQKDVDAGKLLTFDLDAGGTFRKIYMTWRRDTMLSGIEQKFIRMVQELPLQISE